MDELSILDANAGAKRVIERTLTANASQQDTLRNRLAALELKLSEVDKLIVSRHSWIIVYAINCGLRKMSVQLQMQNFPSKML
jgi:hypothetical protein